MADVSLQVSWVFSTNADEASLILSALGGRLRDEDKVAAKALSDKLTLIRANAAQQFVDQMKKHASKVQNST